MKKIVVSLFLLICAGMVFASAVENISMISIVPAGEKMRLKDFAGIEGTFVLDAYEIGKFEATQELYTEVMGENPSYYKGENHPVESVNWFEAVIFCNELTKKTMTEADCCYTVSDITYDKKGRIFSAKVTWDKSKKGFRLPTEAEWEFAAKGGQMGGKDFIYAGSNLLDEVAWYDLNAGKGHHEIGLKNPNMARLFDMSGNVWEWCWDLYKNTSMRVGRGGCWHDLDYLCAVDYRRYSNPENAGNMLGFRLARSL